MTKKDALSQIHKCLDVKSASSRSCSNLTPSIDLLISVYYGGDKSVLTELIRFTYLTDFQQSALLSDPTAFLSAANALSVAQQRAVAEGLAGRPFVSLPKDRFLALKSAYEAVPKDSPNRPLAELFLKALQEHNASPFVDYFPPDAFTGTDGEYKVDMYSRTLFAFGEAPLWRLASPQGKSWRLTYVGAWGGSKTVSLFIHGDGTGTVQLKTYKGVEKEGSQWTSSTEVSTDQVKCFLEAVSLANFWNVPAALPSRGYDGADWVLEGAEDGRYHVVERWCPGFESQEPQVIFFGKASRLLIQFAGQPMYGSC